MEERLSPPCALWCFAKQSNKDCKPADPSTESIWSQNYPKLREMDRKCTGKKHQEKLEKHRDSSQHTGIEVAVGNIFFQLYLKIFLPEDITDSSID